MQRWDIFCRVVDNYGDIGVCWRLSRQLVNEYGIDVRLWVDDLHCFARLCPDVAVDMAIQQVDAVEVRHWTDDFPLIEPADVVIEAFACELPATYVAAMAQLATRPVWINLEYLSAEEWIEGCHLLPSPHPSYPLTKTFFFPGFTPRTGGLLRERDLLTARDAFDAGQEQAFWQRIGIAPRIEGEVRVSLFCYENPALVPLLDCWAAGPTPVRVIATAGAATDQVGRWLGESLVHRQVGAAGLVPWEGEAPAEPFGRCAPIECAAAGELAEKEGLTPRERGQGADTPRSEKEFVQRGSLTVEAIPFLAPADYDRLLWACDVNFVRGEDSFVRAQWAQRPFVWQIYPQADDAHLVKLEAFLARYLQELSESDSVRNCWRAWNGRGDIASGWRDFVANRAAIESYGRVWAGQLDHAADLANNLVRFVRGIP